MFDSGFGGLTVARATIDLLPAEDLVYLGDTARYPYGNRSLDEVRAFAVEIATHLLDRYDVKLIVVACNTAAAAALDLLQASLPVPVIGVIDPGVVAVARATRSGRFAVIGTVGTVASGAYQAAAARLAPAAEVVTWACPGLVEFVERGLVIGPEVEILTRRLLAPLLDHDIDALLLGCTHYPYLSRVIADVVGRNVVLVSSADETAFALADQLVGLDLLRQEAKRRDRSAPRGNHRFITSGDIRAFTELGSRLLGPELIDAEHWPHVGRNDQPPDLPSTLAMVVPPSPSNQPPWAGPPADPESPSGQTASHDHDQHPA